MKVSCVQDWADMSIVVFTHNGMKYICKLNDVKTGISEYASAMDKLGLKELADKAYLDYIGASAGWMTEEESERIWHED